MYTLHRCLKRFSFVVVLVVFLTAGEVHGENILLFVPGGTVSHVLGMWTYVTALADKGHNITLFTAHNPSAEHPKVIPIQSQTLKDLMQPSYNVDRFEDRRLGDEKKLWNTYHDVMVETCEGLLSAEKIQKDPDLRKLLNSSFDLVIINSIYGDCGFIFAHHYKAKYILYHSGCLSVWQSDSFGYPLEASWIPDFSLKFTYPLNLWDRATNVLLPLYWLYHRHTQYFPKMEKIMKDFLKLDYQPDFEQMEREARLVLVNIHHSADFARSLPPQIIPIGGMALWAKEKPLQDNFKTFLDSSGEKGTVFISFGSSIELSTVPIHYQKMFLNLVKKFDDIHFILKWKGSLPDEFQPAPKNLMYSGWLPQKEILRHEKVRAFITHGGLNSIHEATYYGIPLIVLPLFADQDFNAYRVAAQEVGIPIELREISPAILENALQAILSDPKYRKNMKKRSEIFRDRPQSPVETAVYWTEFVLRQDDTSSMKPMSTQLTWYQKRVLDAYGFLLLIAIAILATLYFVLKKVLSLIMRSTSGNIKLKSN